MFPGGRFLHGAKSRLEGGKKSGKGLPPRNQVHVFLFSAQTGEGDCGREVGFGKRAVLWIGPIGISNGKGQCRRRCERLGSDAGERGLA
jgi:hypothetical protein